MQFLKGDIQEGILKAAEEVFLEKGYKDASMREIASRAGVTVSNIYHYFTNKDEIFRTILKPVCLYGNISDWSLNIVTVCGCCFFRHKVLFWRTSVLNIQI